MKSSIIIGLTGAFGSGKSTAASFFESKGFKRITLSFFLEEEATKRGYKKITREILQDIGNEWRKKYGIGILARRTLELLRKEKIGKAIIDGIRNIGEIEEFKKEKSFKLITIVSDRKIRFARLTKVERRESITFDSFTKLDYRDLGIGEEKSGLQVAVCMALADVFIENNGTEVEFKEKLERFIEQKIL
ncbi:MAG: dephospho-CoA kinase [Patescibacteria group bacterium]|nr:dephospho-CoA kinase [Patescibacteria group bacterium]